MSIIQTDINWMRTVTSPTPPLSSSDLYYSMDQGMEGFWRYVGIDTVSKDNTGLTLTNPQYPSSGSNRHVFTRIYDDYICANWFGVIGDETTDNTSQIQLAVDTVIKINGGTLYFGKGIYLTGTITLRSSTLTNRDKVNIKGAGRMSTIFKGISRLGQLGYFKTTQEATTYLSNPLNPETIPIFDVIKSDINLASAFLSFNDLTIIGDFESGNYQLALGEEVFHIDCNYTYDGIRTAMQLHFELGNIEIKGCETCFIGLGSLNFHIHDFLFGGVVKNGDYEKPELDRSNYGIKLTNSTDSKVSANAIRITDGTISCCLKNALTFTHGNLLNLSGIVFEQNGTMDGTNSGAIYIYRKLNDNVSYGNFVSMVNISSCWFELNEGHTILLNDPNSEEDLDNIQINLTGCFFAEMGNENSNGVYLGLIYGSSYGSVISKVNIMGCSSKLPAFVIKAKETVTIGSWFEYLTINNAPSQLISTPANIEMNNILFG